ncbi:DegV family protein with EDD domain [Alteromonadaceae bacterium 2753L.S.0a.02]|nr:DegV family protein with EDD domain [Alteromonadaceae bacterium 2753L.S.0a.02]
MVKTAIIIDSACSLPKQVCDKYGITFVPLTYNVNGTAFSDACDPAQALLTFASGQFDRKNKVFTSAPSSKDFEKAIVAKIKQGYANIIVQTVNRTQGDTYINANEAVGRLKQKLDGKKIALKVMDSRTVFAGQGLMAIETIRRFMKEKSEEEARRKMDKISTKIHTFIIPRSPLVALERSRQRNDTSVSWAQALVASTLGIHPIICNVNDNSSAVGKVWGFEKAADALFNHACTRIEAGLYSPIITVSYGGSVEELRALSGYATLSKLVSERKLKLVPCVASIAAGIYTSVGSLSLGIATDSHSWTG